MILEAICERCGETFNPANDQDLMHEVNQQGVYCGGHGEIQGEYTIPELHMGYLMGMSLPDTHPDPSPPNS